MPRYIVTGAAGFIASRVCEFLLAEGHTVIGIDNMNDSYDVRLKDWRLSRLQGNPNFVFIQKDICDFSEMQKVFENNRSIDGVFNLAARDGFEKRIARASRSKPPIGR